MEVNVKNRGKITVASGTCMSIQFMVPEGRSTLELSGGDYPRWSMHVKHFLSQTVQSVRRNNNSIRSL
jgi:hypothetical protein